MTTTEDLVLEVTPKAPYRKALSAGWGLSHTVGATLGSVLATIPMLIASVIWGSTGAVATVGLITGLLLAFFCTGQLFNTIAMRYPNYIGLTLLVTTWGLRFLALSWALWFFLVRSSHPVWVDRGWFFFTTLIFVSGWVAGLVWANAHQRTLIYEETSQQ